MRTPKPKSNFVDGDFHKLMSKLATFVRGRSEFVGNPNGEHRAEITAAMSKAVAVFEDWQRKEPV